MPHLRKSLKFVATYLLIGGLSLVFFPSETITLFQSNGEYSNVMIRMVGGLLFCLGIIVLQIIRHSIKQLYTTTMFVRSVILFILTFLYFQTRDPMMAILSFLVGIGLFLSLSAYLKDSRS